MFFQNGADLIYTIEQHLEVIFCPGCKIKDLPQETRKAKETLADWLLPWIGTEKREETAEAVSYLFRISRHALPLEDMPPTFRFANAALRMLSVLVSPGYNAAYRYLVHNDPRCLDAYLLESGCLLPSADSEEKSLAERAEVDLIFNVLRECWLEVDASLLADEPVKVLNFRDLQNISDRYRSRESLMPAVYLSINPLEDPEAIIDNVKRLVHEAQQEIVKNHEENWSDDEREFYADGLIDGWNPLAPYIYKNASDKGRNLQTFVEKSFHALVFQELTNRFPNEKETELLRRFFGMKAANYQGANQQKNRLKKAAERLIDNAFAGVALNRNF